MNILQFDYKGVIYTRVLKEPKVGDLVISKNQLLTTLMGNGEVPLGDPHSDPTLWRTETPCQLPLGCPIDFTDVIEIGDDTVTVVKFHHFTFGFSEGNCRLITGLTNPAVGGYNTQQQTRPCPIHTPQHPTYYTATHYPGQQYGYLPQECLCGMRNPPRYR